MSWLKDLWVLFYRGETPKRRKMVERYNAPLWIGDLVCYKDKDDNIRDDGVLRAIYCYRSATDGDFPVGEIETLDKRYPLAPLRQIVLVEKGLRDPSDACNNLYRLFPEFVEGPKEVGHAVPHPVVRF